MTNEPLSEISEFITALAALVAINAYLSKNREAHLSALKSLIGQVQIAGYWFCGDGKEKDPDQDVWEKIELTRPAYLVFDIRKEAIETITLHPGIGTLSQSFLRNLAKLNQTISSMKDAQHIRTELQIRYQEEALLIDDAINKIKAERDRSKLSETPDVALRKLLDGASKLSNNQNMVHLNSLAHRFYSLNHIIHYQLIGFEGKDSGWQQYQDLRQDIKKEVASANRSAILVPGVTLFVSILLLAALVARYFHINLLAEVITVPWWFLTVVADCVISAIILQLEITKLESI